MTGFLDIVLPFFDEIGILYRYEEIPGQTFLPGLKMRNGVLLIDQQKLLYPGDILHEAGHLACMPPRIRKKMNDDLEPGSLHEGGELMAMAWSYAACLHLNISPLVVFHEHGYKGGGQHLADTFASGVGIGVPMLQWSGMCYDSKNAGINNELPFPHMISWTCEMDRYMEVSGNET